MGKDIDGDIGVAVSTTGCEPVSRGSIPLCLPK